MTVLLLGVLAIFGALFFLLSDSTDKEKSGTKKGTFVRKSVLTDREQPMFWQLTKAFPAPEFTVHCQMSFGALLIAKEGASRYSFAQKMADFVVMDKALKVVAIVELDDSSHNGKEAKDGARDAMLKEAGYLVVRYRHVPNIEKLKADIPYESV
jgi:Protein of unknown function (DUF2726)